MKVDRLTDERMSEKVSVVVPVLNRKTLLGRTLSSISEQSWRPLQIVVVDNGSTDGTYEEALRLADKFNAEEGLEIKVIQQSERGASRARNSGFHNVSGEIVLFFDSDDIMMTDAIRTYMQTFTEHPEIDMVIAPFYWLLDDGKRNKRRIRRGDLLTNHFHHCLLSTQSFAAKRKFLSRVESRHGGLWPENLGVWDDWALGMRLLMCCPKVVILKRCVALVEPQAQSITGEAYCQTPPEQYFDAIADVSNTLNSHNELSPKQRAHWENLILYRKVMVAGLLAQESKRMSDDIISRSAFSSREEMERESRRLLDSILASSPNGFCRGILKLAYRYIKAGCRGCALWVTPLLKNYPL